MDDKEYDGRHEYVVWADRPATVAQHEAWHVVRCVGFNLAGFFIYQKNWNLTHFALELDAAAGERIYENWKRLSEPNCSDLVRLG